MGTKTKLSKGARIATLVSCIICMLGGLYMLGVTYKTTLGALWIVVFFGFLAVVNIYKLATDYKKDSTDITQKKEE
jgi:hypothetical protein